MELGNMKPQPTNSQKQSKHPLSNQPINAEEALQVTPKGITDRISSGLQAAKDAQISEAQELFPVIQDLANYRFFWDEVARLMGGNNPANARFFRSTDSTWIGETKAEIYGDLPAQAIKPKPALLEGDRPN